MALCANLCFLFLILVDLIQAQSPAVRFTQTNVEVAEGGQATIGIERIGVLSSDITVVVKFEDVSAKREFEGSSRVVRFTPDGSSSANSEVLFTTVDDDIPEPNESFTLTLESVSSDVTFVSPSSSEITILANDDAFGVIQFADLTPLIVSEQENPSQVRIPVSRERGTFGDVVVSYQVQSEPSNSNSDITPTQGTLLFGEGDANRDIVLTVNADDFPEADETFTVSLIPDINRLARVNNSLSSLSLTIKENDSPIRFSQSVYSVQEAARTLDIEVFRGDSEGVQIGPVTESVTVVYTVTANSAVLGLDFFASNGSLTFMPGQRVKTLSIAIIEDDDPELDETITLRLETIIGDAVFGTPIESRVVILANDDPHGTLSLEVIGQDSLALIIDEDSQSTIFDFVVTRTGGTFGQVGVAFEIISISGEEVEDDIVPSFGVVQLEEGETSAIVPLSVVGDSTPELAENFVIRLINDTVTGGALVSGAVEGRITIRDSDDAFGVVQFSSDSDQSISTAGQPRRLRLLLTRAGGTMGILQVSLNATYHSADSGAVSENIFADRFPVNTFILSGLSLHAVELTLSTEAFLQIGASFVITINDVSLFGFTPPIEPSSPVLGDRTSITLLVTPELANGEIGFSHGGQAVEVNEPDGSAFTEVSLNVTREGTSGPANVYWRVRGLDGVDVSQDIAPQEGTIEMPTGVETDSIPVRILRDNVAETDESFVVEIYNVTPSNQRIRERDSTVRVTILENDDPGGFFEFSPSTLGPFYLSEGVDVADVTILRLGGSLVERSINVLARGDDGSQFYGVPNVVVFPPGVSSRVVSITAVSDGIPELNTTFDLVLTPYGDPASKIGTQRTVSLVVRESDDPYGVVRFPVDQQILEVRESTLGRNFTAEFTILRDQGTFGEIAAHWMVNSSLSVVEDVYPTEGTVIFQDGVNQSSITIQSIDDQIPEQRETFSIELLHSTGGSRVGQPSTANLIINSNDDALYIQEPTVCAVEPSRVTLSILKVGGASTPASVKYRTLQGDALEGIDYLPLEGTARFDDGVTNVTVIFQILEDLIPEAPETFQVELYEAIGDVVILGNPRTTVTICPSDVPGGLVSFQSSQVQIAEEGSTLEVLIQRMGGRFGSIRVFWLLFQPLPHTPRRLNDGEEFEQVEGYVGFQEGQAFGVITLRPLQDGIPEFTETYYLTILNVTVDDPSLEARLAVGGTALVDVSILANDDPYGVLDFENPEQEVAEDYYLGEMSWLVNVTVRRQQGLAGDVSVIWEVLSDAVASGWPNMLDLLFVSEVEGNLNVSPAMSERRDGSGTVPYLFSGTTGSVVTLPPEVDVAIPGMNRGFSISAWVKPAPASDGFILSKVDADSPFRMLYGLKVDMTRNQTVYIEFRYSNNEGATNYAPGFTLRSNFGDDNWHLLAVSVNTQRVIFYVDGEAREESSIQGPVADGSGVIYVGGFGPNRDLYQGLLQDVRAYDRELLPRDVAEIWDSPAGTDFAVTSGILTFQEGQDRNSLQISTSQDEDPEGNELYQVLLISGAGGARVESDARTLLSVLKSDNANGLFGFDGPCLPIGQGDENTTFGCPVRRSRGDTGVVTIPWEVRNQAGELAVLDFENATGEVVFHENVREITIRLTVWDDDLPELSERFDVILLDRLPLSDDGLVGSTNTSGASIDTDRAVNTVVVAQSDNPYGLFQFSLDDPPGSSDPIIGPATSNVDLTVPEDVGVARLLVVRAQGLLGAVSLEWRTIDGTAVSAGKDPIDFQSGGGTLNFVDRQRFAYIDISVLDNEIPELSKTFQVELSNPTGGAALGLGAVIEVTIDSSDNAYGVFQFSESSLLTSVDEGDAFQLQVIRLGGALGEVTLYWTVMADAFALEADPASDVSNPSGNVTFAVNEMSLSIEIFTVDDELPELDETFVVVLTFADAGTIGSSNTSVFAVLANDDPYGVFIFSSDSATVRTPERNESVVLQIVREKGSMGTVQVTYSSLGSLELLPSMPAFTSRAQEELDFIPLRGSLIFEPGQTSAFIEVTILDDDQPESEESIFITINSIFLLGSETFVDGSPRRGEPNVAEIEILANDNANGVLQLSTDFVVISEDSLDPVINVTRTAGAFGMVTVKFQAVQVSALENVDYSVTSTDVILHNGETSKRLPIEIIDDRIPELNETFQVRLLDQITGGAILGTPVEAEIMIAPSDDPNGNFGFGTSSQVVVEPGSSDERQLSISLVRSSGTLGVVAVQWEARLNGALATEDVFPTGGTLHFLSGDVTDSFNIRILPDDVPEEREDIEVSLISASGGGVIGEQNTIVITIEANDDPHGVVEFAREINRVVEVEGINSQADIPVIRSGGLFGELEVTYTTQQSDLVEEALKMTSSVLDLYEEPVAGSLSGVVKTDSDVSSAASPLMACAERCLQERACGAFEFQRINLTVFCRWSVTDGNEVFNEQLGVSLYRKDLEMTKLLYESQAVSGTDYSPIIVGTLRIPEGQNTSSATVNILDDLLPERDEVFMINLLSVRAVDTTPLRANRPTISTRSTARVVIESNDDANGIWAVYSNSPNAAGPAIVRVQEREGISVSEELVIERRGGTIGDVSVSWRVSESTATPALDYTASGGTVNFGPGETRQVINIGIKDDEIPEDDEMLVIEIYDPTGGSVLSDQNNVTVVILANDNVAGVLGFVQLSYIVSEGQSFNVTVERSLPAKGTVYLEWLLSGSNGYLPGQSFLDTNGSLSFSEGELSGSISLTVLSDETPESNEEFVLTLYDIITEGVSPSGAASLEPRSSVASITIQASDEPHGVFTFAQGSLSLNVEEGDKTVQLFVERKFGAIGTVQVGYTIQEIDTGEEFVGTPASDGLDFVAQSGTVEFGDEQNTAAIDVVILEDELPELDEVFRVALTSVTLLDPSITSFPPKLGSLDTASEVTITANDGTQGIVGFNVSSDRILVPEDSQNVVITIVRDRGTYGEVTVFLYSQSIEARKERDYVFEDQILRFADGEFVKEVVVTILEDNIPEDSESFELILNNPTGGLELGEPMRVTLTIQPNDDAFGIIAFSEPFSLTIYEPNDTPGANSLASFSLVRDRGTFGQVEVPFTIEGGDDDVFSPSGFVTFEPDDVLAFLQIFALADSIPELSETFRVVLGEPIGGATLGMTTEVTVVVEESDAPYGLLQIYPLFSRNDSVEVEEDVDVVHFVVERSGGQIGTVSVNVATMSGSAVSLAGNVPRLGAIQTLNVAAASDYHTFTYNGDWYLVVLSDKATGPLMTSRESDGSSFTEQLGTGSTLYRWQGVFVPVQTIETDGALGCASHLMGGTMYLAIANHGTPGRRITSTRIYSLTDSGALIVVQDIQTTGASAVAFLTRGTDVYLFVAQQVNAAEGSVTDSQLFLWSGSMFVPSRSMETVGAAAVVPFDFGGNQYVAVANYYNSQTARYNIRSRVYRWQNGILNEHQQLDTMGAADVETVMIGTNYFLVVANSRNDEGTDVVNSVIYHWNPAFERFEIHQYVPTSGCRSVASFTADSGATYLVFANPVDDSIVLVWNSFTAMFEMVSSYKSLGVVEGAEFTTGDGTRRSMLLAGPGDVDQPGPSVLQLSLLSESADYVPWSTTLSFSPEDTSHIVAVTVLPDDIPEDDEVMLVALSNPTNGAMVGAQDRVSTIIASNDDAHGIVVFAQESLQMNVMEQASDTPVVLTVERLRGSAGLVVVAWEASGDHDMADLRPLRGEIEFLDGISTSAIVLTVIGDSAPELDETTFIRLTEVVNPGTTREGRGAVIGADDNTAALTVIANDSPHGVFGWSIDSLYAITDEPEGSQTTRLVTLFLTREQGRTGRVNVYYSTFQSASLPEIEQATSDRDFVRTNSFVSFADGAVSASVVITVLPDTAAEGPETFFVNLTSVELVSVVPQGGAAPSIKNGQSVAEITIRQNDNANGILQFSAVKNDNGEVEVYEGSGTDGHLLLPVTRSAGAIGNIGFGWTAKSITASSSLDFSPVTGNISMATGQREATIDISIIDDEIEEDAERFTVHIDSPSGGAVLGEELTLLVKILKNDSPRGLFGFSYDQETVPEGGEVSFTVERTQGSQGPVEIFWQLEAGARDDLTPTEGVLRFQEGTTRRTITIDALEDEVLEGEERFTVTISSDEDVEISPVRNTAMVVIQPDEGSSGVVSVLPESRNVLIGEPTATHDGEAMIRLTRGIGIFGEVQVSWQISPADGATFQDTSGSVSFIDGQGEATIIVQTVDDSIPELKREFTLILASISGGASIDPADGANQASITVVASDNPFGVFEFPQPLTMTVDEDAQEVRLSVVRLGGIYGRIQVNYTTAPGTAISDEDYVRRTDAITFGEGEDTKNIRITILPDNIPEGPETFQVILTSVTLLSPLDASFVDQGGLQLDMPPLLGSGVEKEIMIEKNDNAEGIIEFTDSLLEVPEDVGSVSVPVVRSGGTFGLVSALYSVRNLSASPDGVDYILSDGEVIFLDGQSRASIRATVIDDQIKEFSESFAITLTGARGGATLGRNLTTEIAIVKSDGPDGLIGFAASDLNRIITNPSEVRDMRFTIELTGGSDEYLIGAEVRWRILGPNSEDILTGTEDIATSDGRLQGSVTFEPQTRGSMTFDLQIRPYFGPEVEEVFKIEIYQIVGAGEIVRGRKTALLTIRKQGDPNGIIQFDEDSQQMRTFAEPADDRSPTVISFGIQRRAGAVGDVQVYWEVQDENKRQVTKDVFPSNGTVDIPSGVSTSRILLSILPDRDPELEESFQLVLISAQGGAEIDPQLNISRFSVRPNDDPHGIFGVRDEDQSILLDDESQRYLRIQVTRDSGTVGAVQVNFDLTYNDGVTGAVVPPRGSLTCRDGEPACITDIDLINNDIFLERDTSFTVTLTNVEYIGSDATILPLIDLQSSSATFRVPQSVANSLVGFLLEDVTVSEENYQAEVIIDRNGAYGAVEVEWQAGYPVGGLPQGFSEGDITPASGFIRFNHGESQKVVVVLLRPTTLDDVFALHITSVQSPDDGGAMEDQERSLVEIAPSGIISFGQRSRDVVVDESDGEVELVIQRQLGTQGVVTVVYQTTASTATPGNDYVEISGGVIRLTDSQQTATITIVLQARDGPQVEKVFFVNITSVEGGDLTQDGGPLLSNLNSVAMVTIRASNDPYGVFSMHPTLVETMESGGPCKLIELTINRTGGDYGQVSLKVRTVGGGERWETDLIRQHGNETGTIGAALATEKRNASAGFDYKILEETIIFREKETTDTVQLEVCDDSQPEPNEIFYVYLTDVTGGARVAGPADAPLKGYTEVIILGNDNFNGIVGFSDDSLYTSVDEDEDPTVMLNLDRGVAFFETVMVDWRATYSTTGDIGRDNELAGELVEVEGSIQCPAMAQICKLPITLRQDTEPEFETSFAVELVGVRPDASLNPNRRLANITMKDSDHPYGRFGFSSATSLLSVTRLAQSVSLSVERSGGRSLPSSVSWETVELQSSEKMGGVNLQPALEELDYVSSSGTLDFSNEFTQQLDIRITLPPKSEMEVVDPDGYPKLFRVRLFAATNGASVNAMMGEASVVITLDDLNTLIWRTWLETEPLVTNDNPDIIRTLSDTSDYVNENVLTPNQMTLVIATLDNIITEGYNERFSTGTENQLLDIFCDLLDPSRTDTIGVYELAESFTRFSYTLVFDRSCSNKPERSVQCERAKVTAARLPREDINGKEFSGQIPSDGLPNYFKLPPDLLDVAGDVGSTCEDVHFIEYNSQQWFLTNNNPVLNEQILSVGIRGAENNFTSLSTPVEYRIYTTDRRVTPRGAQCAIFSPSSNDWQRSSCEVTSDHSNFVECACYHLSEFAAEAQTDNLVGYNVFVDISCYVVMICFFLALMTHQVCAVFSMFAARLLMHMCFAAMCLQIIFITSTNVSEWVSPQGCTALGVLIHYFLLSQFSWIFVQGVNFWKVFVMNDEHTDRYYIIFFVAGWTLPVAVIVLYVVIMYAAFDWPFVYDPGSAVLDPSQVIYGDVHNNGDICFIPNGYAALASVVGPALLSLVAVLVIFMQAFQVKPQWKRYDDIYMGRYNTTEVKLIFIFWVLICITWFFAGLHLVFSQLWLLIFFIILNFAQGFYAFIVYTVLRNQLCRPNQGNYSLNNQLDNAVTLLENNRYNSHSNLVGLPPEKGSVKGTLTKAEIKNLEGYVNPVIQTEWDAESVSHRSHHSLNLVKPPSVHGSNLFSPTPFDNSQPAIVEDDDNDSQEFDDLIFALKTGGALSINDSGSSAAQKNKPVWPDRPPQRSTSSQSRLRDTTAESVDHYEVRKVAIADTHL